MYEKSITGLTCVPTDMAMELSEISATVMESRLLYVIVNRI